MKLRILCYAFCMLSGLGAIAGADTPSAPALPVNPPSPLAGLTDAEQSYYEQIFTYSMENTPANSPFEWKTYGGSGAITPLDKLFASKSKSFCRHYRAHFTIAGAQSDIDGVACKRMGKEGWCHLKPTDAQTCAMELPATELERELRDTSEAVEAKKFQFNDWLYFLKNRF